MNLVEIGGKNFTQHIKVPSYKVNRAEEYEEWKDANYRKHREIVRTKVSGNFTMLYDVIAELDEFFDTIETLKAASDTGAIEMTVYLNNLHTVDTITAFIKYTPANERPLLGKEKVSGFDVTIEEQ